MKFICFIFNLPWPKINIGDIFVHKSDKGNPFDSIKYKVVEIQNNWAKVQVGSEACWHTNSLDLRHLRAFYIKI